MRAATTSGLAATMPASPGLPHAFPSRLRVARLMSTFREERPETKLTAGCMARMLAKVTDVGRISVSMRSVMGFGSC